MPRPGLFTGLTAGQLFLMEVMKQTASGIMKRRFHNRLDRLSEGARSCIQLTVPIL